MKTTIDTLYDSQKLLRYLLQMTTYEKINGVHFVNYFVTTFTLRNQFLKILCFFVMITFNRANINENLFVE
jgi:hypothetical protein